MKNKTELSDKEKELLQQVSADTIRKFVLSDERKQLIVAEAMKHLQAGQETFFKFMVVSQLQDQSEVKTWVDIEEQTLINFLIEKWYETGEGFAFGKVKLKPGVNENDKYKYFTKNSLLLTLEKNFYVRCKCVKEKGEFIVEYSQWDPIQT